jgi:hypothetical protein
MTLATRLWWKSMKSNNLVCCRKQNLFGAARDFRVRIEIQAELGIDHAFGCDEPPSSWECCDKHLVGLLIWPAT